MDRRKSFYAHHIAPRLVHLSYSADAVASMRERIVPRASGVVVEIGFGSGLNLPHYDPARVDRLIGIDPDEAIMSLAESALARTLFPVELRGGSGERIPLKDAVADTVVITYALCAIGEPDRALQEIRRILKPSGRLLFCEHAAATGFCARLQHALEGIWRRLSGGCRLTCDPVATMMAAGFAVDELAVQRFPPLLMLLGTHYSGQAHVRTFALPRTAQPAAPLRSGHRARRQRSQADSRCSRYSAFLSGDAGAEPVVTPGAEFRSGPEVDVLLVRGDPKANRVITAQTVATPVSKTDALFA